LFDGVGDDWMMTEEQEAYLTGQNIFTALKLSDIS